MSGSQTKIAGALVEFVPEEYFEDHAAIIIARAILVERNRCVRKIPASKQITAHLSALSEPPSFQT
ncbi:hypothetical protein ASG42_27315 [Rhizobium sp. Leaf391]|nr:hypothetical protein ASG42_27315 [Rhizobium sp. Leaf391]KQT06770.1 hypothetical protein ASG50_13700 [Rhizobium sp. Leaf386]